MSLEGSPKKQEKKHSNLLEVGALAATMLLQSHPGAKALEVPTDTPWVTAIQENVKKSVKNEKLENYFVYLKFSDDLPWNKEYGKWLPAQEGNSKWVIPAFSTGAEQMEKHVETEGKKEWRSVLKSICIGHTHTTAATKKSGIEFGVKSENLDTLPAPPGPGDIRGISNIKRGYRFEGVGHLTDYFNYFVADQRGIWYYRQANKLDYNTPQEQEMSKKIGTNEAQENWWKDFEALTLKSESGLDLTGSLEYKKLLESYKINLGGSVRFVSYEQVAGEPPCAGVDFDPTKKVEQPEDFYTPKHTH